MTRATKGHSRIQSRHVDVMFPMDCSQPDTTTTTTPCAPSAERELPPGAAFVRGAVRVQPAPTPKPLVSSEWMNSLVQFVASQKKICYDGAREELGDALKASIPMEMRESLLRKSDVQVGGITKVGQVSEQVSTHLSLTSKMSMRRLQQQNRQRSDSFVADDPFMTVSPHYICEDADVDEPALGRLEAYMGNAMLQALRLVRGGEVDHRARIEKLHVRSIMGALEDLEVELRAILSQAQTKEWNKLCGREVADYLASRRREQTSSRNSTIAKGAERLKAEKEAVRRDMLAALAREGVESEAWVAEAERLFEECYEELPTGPNYSQIDAEVARLILRERRQKVEYFPDVL